MKNRIRKKNKKQSVQYALLRKDVVDVTDKNKIELDLSEMTDEDIAKLRDDFEKIMQEVSKKYYNEDVAVNIAMDRNFFDLVKIAIENFRERIINHRNIKKKRIGTI